jgi:hypothetical protein
MWIRGISFQAGYARKARQQKWNRITLVRKRRKDEGFGIHSGV